MAVIINSSLQMHYYYDRNQRVKRGQRLNSNCVIVSFSYLKCNYLNTNFDVFYQKSFTVFPINIYLFTGLNIAIVGSFLFKREYKYTFIFYFCFTVIYFCNNQNGSV